MRRCVVWSCFVVALVVVQLAQPYNMVGVIVELNKWIRERSGWRALVSSFLKALNFRQAMETLLSISVVW